MVPTFFPPLPFSTAFHWLLRSRRCRFYSFCTSSRHYIITSLPLSRTSFDNNPPKWARKTITFMHLPVIDVLMCNSLAVAALTAFPPPFRITMPSRRQRRRRRRCSRSLSACRQAPCANKAQLIESHPINSPH